MEYLAVIAAAVVGSTGLAGIATAGLQWTRRSRLRRIVEQSIAIQASLEPDTLQHRVMEEAIRLDTLQLAALSIVPVFFKRSLVLYSLAGGWIVGTVAVRVAGAFGAVPQLNAADKADWLPDIVGITVAMVMFVVAFVDDAIARPRRAYVAHVLGGGAIQRAISAPKPSPTPTK